jgi:hypothetical protein
MTKSSKIRTYTELRRIASFEDRFKYLAVHSSIGIATFGFERWLNQAFYTSATWRTCRHIVIARDLGCDLGVEGYEVHDKIIVHHMNPVTVQQVEDRDPSIFDPEFLISVSHNTHNAVHYGNEKLLAKPLVERRPNDTRLW